MTGRRDTHFCMDESLPSSSPTLMTVDQTAERLQVSKSMVYALVESGKLSCHRIGIGRGTIRISDEDLASYLETTRFCNSAEVKPPRRKRLRHIRL